MKNYLTSSPSSGTVGLREHEIRQEKDEHRNYTVFEFVVWMVMSWYVIHRTVGQWRRHHCRNHCWAVDFFEIVEFDPVRRLCKVEATELDACLDLPEG